MFGLEQVSDRQPLQANFIQSVPVAPGVTGGWIRQQMSREKLFFAARAPATWLQGLLRARWANGLQKCGLDSELFLEITSAGGRSQRGGRGVPYRRALCLALHSFLNALSPVGHREGPRTRWLCPNSRRHSSSWTPRCSIPEHFFVSKSTGCVLLLVSRRTGILKSFAASAVG